MSRVVSIPLIGPSRDPGRPGQWTFWMYVSGASEFGPPNCSVALDNREDEEVAGLFYYWKSPVGHHDPGLWYTSLQVCDHWIYGGEGGSNPWVLPL